MDRPLPLMFLLAAAGGVIALTLFASRWLLRRLFYRLAWISTDHYSDNTGRQLQPGFSSYRQSN